MSISNITLSAGVRSNLLNLQTTANDKNLTQTRLSTGKKVNTALDNPSNFFTASSLTSRANDLSNLLDGMANGIQTIQAANNGLTSITTTLQSMQSTLNQARQDKSFQTQSYTLDTATIGTASAKHLTISGGSVGTTGVDIDLNVVAGGGGTPAHQASVTSTVSYSPPASAVPHVDGSTTGAAYSTSNAFETGKSITIDGVSVSFDGKKADGTTDITAHGGTEKYTSAEAIDKINAALTNGSSTVVASADGGGGIKLTKAGGNVTIGSADLTSNGGLGNGSSSNYAAGSPAATFSFTVNGHSVTLDSTASGSQSGDTGLHAAASITTQLSAYGVSAAYTGGHLVLSGAAAGTNSIAVAGTNAATLFGTALSDTGTPAGGGAGASVKSVDDLVTTINGNNTLTGKVLASNDNGKLRIQNLSTQDLTIAGITSGKADGSNSTSTVAGNSVRTSLAKQFNDLRDQITKYGDDSFFNGTNLLRGDNMKLTLNETGTSFINVQSQNAQGNAASIDNTFFGISNQQATDFDSDSHIDAQLDTIKNALSSVRSVSSSLGSQLSSVENRQSFTKAMINTLQTGSDNLTLADTNEEGANLLALNTRQQLETTSLSFASQADQAVLSFLR